jgi:adenosylmethionine-8-amino-7-oxononanoate aminotransferase
VTPPTESSPRPEVGGTQDIFYARTSLPRPLIERASGIYMWDDQGREYIDASSGPMVSAIGHCNERVADAIAAQARQLDYAYSLVARNRRNLEFSERLARLAGPGFERVSLTSGGSEAVDHAVKFVRQYAIATGQESRKHLIALDPSYHGATVSTLALGGDPGFDRFLDGFATRSAKVPAPVSYRIPDGHTQASYAAFCAEELERTILALGAETVLAFVVEPVGGLSTGAVVPPADYFRAIRAICDRHGVFLIFDEVLCGMGRTGEFITARHWPDAMPDIVVMAKGLGSGYTPLGAMLAPATLVDELTSASGFNFSYSANANPISCAAGLAVLDEFERLDLVHCASERGAQLEAGLRAFETSFPIVGDVRGLGLIWAVELVADKTTTQPLPAEFQPNERALIHGHGNGLMLYARSTAGAPHGNWFMVAPPLTITEAETVELLRRLEATLAGLCSEADAEGLLSR